MMLTLTTRKKQFLFGYFSEDVEIAKKFWQTHYYYLLFFSNEENFERYSELL